MVFVGVLAFVLSVFGQVSGAADFGRLLSGITARFDGHGAANFQRWRALAESDPRAPSSDKLKRVNDFFNRLVDTGDDQAIWGQSDYWATPMETLGMQRGDCEDFAIAKYFTLLHLGIPNDQLRLVYAKATIGGPGGIAQAHMVLAFYSSPTAEPLVLDNLISDIRPASRRPDLSPVFSFNQKELWAGAASDAAKGPGGSGRLSRWEDLLTRVRAEGFD